MLISNTSGFESEKKIVRAINVSKVKYNNLAASAALWLGQFVSESRGHGFYSKNIYELFQKRLCSILPKWCNDNQSNLKLITQ